MFDSSGQFTRVSALTDVTFFTSLLPISLQIRVGARSSWAGYIKARISYCERDSEIRIRIRMTYSFTEAIAPHDGGAGGWPTTSQYIL